MSDYIMKVKLSFGLKNAVDKGHAEEEEGHIFTCLLQGYNNKARDFNDIYLQVCYRVITTQ